MKSGRPQEPDHCRGIRKGSTQTGVGETFTDGIDPRWMGAVISIDRWHFHRRLLERYGIVLGPADYSRIARSIARHEVPLIDTRPDGTAVYLVRVPSSGSLFSAKAKSNGELITALNVNDRLAALLQLWLANGR